MDKNCSSCRNWISGVCREGPPSVGPSGLGVWPKTEATDWCYRFRPTVRARGQPAKFTDDQVIEAVKVYDTVVDHEGKPTARMAVKRTDLIYTLVSECGVTETPALRRIQKLVQNGRLRMGDNPWPLKDTPPGIYVWLGEEMKAEAAGPDPDKKPAQDFLALARMVAPGPEDATSLRSIVRQIEHTLPMSVATASRKMARLVMDGTMIKSDAGYYAAPFTPPVEI